MFSQPIELCTTSRALKRHVPCYILDGTQWDDSTFLRTSSEARVLHVVDQCVGRWRPTAVAKTRLLVANLYPGASNLQAMWLMRIDDFGPRTPSHVFRVVAALHPLSYSVSRGEKWM